MIDSPEVRAARRRVTDALHASHADQQIIVSDQLAKELGEAWDAYDKLATKLERELCAILGEHVGEAGTSEGAVEVLHRIESDHNMVCPQPRHRAPSPAIDLEELSSRLHDVYQKEAHRRGDVRHEDAYAELPESTKEWDRVLARWILEHFTPGFYTGYGLPEA